MKNQDRCFSLTKAIRKAERNAKERLIPVPRAAMVQMVKQILAEHVKKSGGTGRAT
jgi:ribosomal protein S5